MHRKQVTLLSKLRRDTLEDFTKAGIQTLDQIVAMSPEDLQRFRGIKTTASAFHASARAWVEECAIWYGELHPVCHASAAYFDIETWQNDFGETEVWSIGWCGADLATHTVVVADVKRPTTVGLPDLHQVILVPDADSAWRVFADSVSSSGHPILHWTGYDAGVMRKSAPEDVKQALGLRLRDLCKMFDEAVKLPIKGVSLKTVARHLGFNWRGYDDWLAAYLDYRKWQNTDDTSALASACAYQRDDVEAMVVVQRWLHENAPNK